MINFKTLTIIIFISFFNYSVLSDESDKVTNAGSVTRALKGTSIQVAYSVGGASIKFAESEVDNQNYVASTNREGRTIALSLAF